MACGLGGETPGEKRMLLCTLMEREKGQDNESTTQTLTL